MRLYFDAVTIIYWVEGIEPWEALVRARLARPQVQTITSELSVLECRVRPIRLGQRAVLADFDRFFAVSLRELLPITREVLERGAELRAKYAFLKTPDAIHLAAAIGADCDGFLTNDHRLERCAGEITVEVLAPGL